MTSAQQMQIALDPFQKLGETFTCISQALSPIESLNSQISEFGNYYNQALHPLTAAQYAVGHTMMQDESKNIREIVSSVEEIGKQLNFLDTIKSSLDSIGKTIYAADVFPSIFSVEDFCNCNDSEIDAGVLIKEAKSRFYLKEDLIAYVEELFSRFKATGDLAFIYKLKKVINDASLSLISKLSKNKRWIKKLIAKLYFNDCIHKISLRLLAKQMFKIPSHDDEDTSSVFRTLVVLKIKSSYYGRKISIG
jgi:hypothetical protein